MAGLVLMGTLDSWQNSPLEFQFYKFGPCNLLNKPYGPLKYYYPKTKPAKPLPPKPQPTPVHQAQSHQNILPVHFNTSPSQTPSLTISPTWLPTTCQNKLFPPNQFKGWDQTSLIQWLAIKVGKRKNIIQVYKSQEKEESRVLVSRCVVFNLLV